MRLGYSFWGFLGDVKEDAQGNTLSTPDGNATYSWSIIYEAQRRGWGVWSMQQDRDSPAWDRYGRDLFSAFSQDKRSSAYENMMRSNGTWFPELDVLLLEWRFPIPGRNTPDMKDQVGYQPDLERQQKILDHYRGQNTKIIIWDLDHKLTLKEEMAFSGEIGGPDAIFETSIDPLHQMWHRTSVEFPTVVDDLLQLPSGLFSRDQGLVYIGNRYERDEMIDRYIEPISVMFPGIVSFYGNWPNTIDECRSRWPGISFHGRVTTRDFHGIYKKTVACPLLAKQSYFDTGFVTPRVWEAILFGTIPIGFEEHLGIHNYCQFVARDSDQLTDYVELLGDMNRLGRMILREEAAHRVKHMDVKFFVDEIERVVG